MKASAKTNLLILMGCGLLLVGVFAKPLGISSSFEIAIELMALVILVWGVFTVVKAKKAGEIPAMSTSQKQKKFWMLVAVYAASSVPMPFLLPLTGVSLPFSELVVLSIITFFLCIGITWLTMKLTK
jgi:hypothetical protein